MADHHQHHHQYGLPDLQQMMAERGRATHFLGTQQPGTDPLIYVHSTRNVNNILTPPPPPPQTHLHFESMPMMFSDVMSPASGLFKLGHEHYCTNATSILTSTTTSISSTTSSVAAAATTDAAALYRVEMESGWFGNDVVGGLSSNNNSRWPRQETLTLLEIRSRLDSKFKEANQKGPLWDEVSRIMAEEHGYQRSGKKCREKFENLYKYYKKTKEGKAGRQDGKHYRFFRQLEALYGESSNNQDSASETHFVNANFPCQTTINQENQETFQENKHSDQSLSFSNTSEFETSSSENNDDDLSAIAYMMNRSREKQKPVVIGESQSYVKAKKGWKTKVKDYVDFQMSKLMDTQEVWMEKMLKTIEEREHERVTREEEWMKQEVARFEQEHEFWAKERAWIEARDAALMETFNKCTGKGQDLSSSIEQITIATQEHKKNQNIISTAKKINYSAYDDSSLEWSEPEIVSLIQLRTTMEPRFQASVYTGGLWEAIAAEMANLGYDHNADECKEKWEKVNIYFNMTTECNKKRKEELTTARNYFQNLESYNGDQEMARARPLLEGMNLSVSANSYVGSQVVQDSSSFQAPFH